MASEIDLDRSTGLITPGVHNFRIKDFKEEQGSEYPYWQYTCICTEAGEDNGKTTVLRVSLSPSARWKLDQFLDAVDAPRKGKITGDKFVGKLFRGNVDHETFQGNVRSQIAQCIPAGADVTPAAGGTPNAQPKVQGPVVVQGPAPVVQGPVVQGPAVQGPVVQGPAVEGPAVDANPGLPNGEVKERPIPF